MEVINYLDAACMQTSQFTLSIQTVFILRENILFLEEWIKYHLALGVQRFFLYDNSNSAGYDGSTRTTNRYNICYAELTAHLTDEAILALRDRLLDVYGRYIVYTQWDPLDDDGKVTFGQRDAIMHYKQEYADKDGWTAFIDMDEYIYSRYPIKEVLKKSIRTGISDIVILQKKFKDRFTVPYTPVTEIVDCIEGIDTSGWAPKHILRHCKLDFNLPYWNWGIHNLPVRNCGRMVADIHHLRFNHYNVNETQLSWMKAFYNTPHPFSLNATCDELLQQYRAMLAGKGTCFP